MNKKEVSEIKSLFKRDGGAIDRICGCLIDGEQQIRMTFSDMFCRCHRRKSTSILKFSERRFQEVWVKIFIHSITRLIRNFRGKAISV